GLGAMRGDGGAETDLTDPQATFAFDLVGLDSASTSLELLAITDAGRAFPGIRIKSTRCGGRHGSERFHRATEVGRGEANAGDGIPWGNAGRRHWPLSQPIPVARHSLRNQDDRAALQRSQPGTELPHRLRRLARLPARRQAALSARI